MSFGDAFDDLEAAEQSVLVLIYGAALTERQIADRLALTEPVVRRLACRGLVGLGNRMRGIQPK